MLRGILIIVMVAYGHCVGRRPRIAEGNLLKDNDLVTISIKISNTSSVIYERSFPLFYNPDQQQINAEIQLPAIPESDNYSIYAQLFQEGQSEPILTNLQNLTRLRQIRNNTNSDMMMTDGIETQQEDSSPYVLHFPKNYVILFIHMQGPLREVSAYKRAFGFSDKIVDERLFYIPAVDMSQLHVPFKTYVPAHTVNGTHKMNLNIRVYPMMYFQMFFGFTQPQLMKEANPYMSSMYSDEMIDMIKEMLFTNHLYLTAAFFILSTLQTFMQLFAFKNEIEVWKKVQEKGGLSIKALYQGLVMEIIIILYLLDRKASQFYLFLNGLQLILTLWKITRAVEVKFNTSFPFIRFGYKPWYHRKTETADSEAIHYTSYLTGALFSLYIVYKGYGLYNLEQWSVPSFGRAYSFTLESLVMFIFLFGFVLMTPQLYINYRLKSVDHLPWKTLIYRFISAIIDDIFVFMIELPMLQRMFSFRDDIIFILYLVQRRMYSVDPSRIALSTASVDMSKLKPSNQHEKTQ